MYAITVSEPGGADKITWAQVPTPEPGPGEVLVRTQAVGVNRGDVLQRQGHYPPPAGATEVMGLEGLGIIAELGEGVGDHEVGEQVLALLAGGAYAEYFVASAEHLLPVPAGVDPVKAAGLVEVAATVVSNFDRVGLGAGETVLIHGGAGGVGGFAIQYAKALGARVLLAVVARPGVRRGPRALGAGGGGQGPPAPTRSSTTPATGSRPSWSPRPTAASTSSSTSSAPDTSRRTCAAWPPRAAW